MKYNVLADGTIRCYFKELDISFIVDKLENAITIGVALGIAKEKLKGGKINVKLSDEQRKDLLNMLISR